LTALIEVKSLSKTYQGVPALRNVSFKLQNGRLYGIIGGEGDGKSTLLRLLAGVLNPDEGVVKINGFDMAKEPVAAKSCIGYLAEEAPIYEGMTPVEYLSFMAEVRGLSYERGIRRVNEAVERAQLERYRNTLIRNLPVGAVRRLAVVQAALGKQDILILDDPFSGLDEHHRAEVRDLIRELAENRTVILSTTDTEQASLCDRILWLREGELYRDLWQEEFDRDARAEFREMKKNKPSKTSAAVKARARREGEYEILDEDEGGDAS
jgi:ABC-2 type transport system ATP-binding protein